jgi:aminoglycoside phosphotransferase family enzyme/predicted kinase
MELPQLIDALSDPAAYPYPVTEVVVRQTHISAVFLAGPFAYKIKKPVHPGFLDFRTLELRRHFCEEEVRLNRRLAPTVYHGVVPVTRDGTRVQAEGHGQPIEWAVKMERLPEAATLQHGLEHGQIDAATLRSLAAAIAAFHGRAETNARIASFGRFEMVARNIRDNLNVDPSLFGVTVSRAVFERLRSATEAALARLQPLIDCRAERGVPRDVHGDLRVDHVYLFPERAPPADVVVVDCIEFNERFRYIDPVADMAFLVLGLLHAGRRDLAMAFAEAYFRASGDDEGRALLPLYTVYRAEVRGKVEGMKYLEPEVPSAEREAARMLSRAHWLLALGEAEPAERRQALILMAGLPGAGKSTLARAVAERLHFEVIRSDVVRKELAANVADAYAPEWTDRTYAECLRRAEALLFEGRRVIVDANFRREAQRRLFLEAAVRWGVRGLLLVCRASPEVVRERLSARSGDASDATWTIYQRLAAEWEEPGDFTRRWIHDVVTDGRSDDVLAHVLSVLREREVGRC